MEKSAIANLLKTNTMGKKRQSAKEKLDKVKLEAQEQMRKVQAAAEKRAQELREQIEAAEEEELRERKEQEMLYKDTVSGIDELADKGDFFVGVILTHNDILAVIDLAIKSKEAIKIPYRLYNKEDDTMAMPPKEPAKEDAPVKDAELPKNKPKKHPHKDKAKTK